MARVLWAFKVAESGESPRILSAEVEPSKTMETPHFSFFCSISVFAPLLYSHAATSRKLTYACVRAACACVCECAWVCACVCCNSEELRLVYVFLLVLTRKFKYR